MGSGVQEERASPRQVISVGVVDGQHPLAAGSEFVGELVEYPVEESFRQGVTAAEAGTAVGKREDAEEAEGAIHRALVAGAVGIE